MFDFIDYKTILTYIGNNLLPIIAFFTLYSAIKHNRLSLRPIIGFEIHFIEEGNSGKIIVAVENGGTGPAIIKEFALVYKDTRMVTTLKEYENMIDEKFIIDDKCIKCKPRTVHMNEHDVVKVNARFNLFSLEFKTDKDHGKDIIQSSKPVNALYWNAMDKLYGEVIKNTHEELVSNFSWEIKYQSVYESKVYTVSSKPFLSSK